MACKHARVRRLYVREYAGNHSGPFQPVPLGRCVSCKTVLRMALAPKAMTTPRKG